jgi:hypothetical protein
VWQLLRHARTTPGVDRSARTNPRSVAVFSTQAAVLVVVAVLGLPVLLWVATWIADKITPQVRNGVSGAVGSVLLTYAASLAALLWRKRTTIGGALKRGRSKGVSQATAAVPRGLLQLLLVVLTLAVLYVGWLLLFGVTASAMVSATGSRLARPVTSALRSSRLR